MTILQWHLAIVLCIVQIHAQCPDGMQLLNDTCTDIDECLISPCALHRTCQNRVITTDWNTSSNSCICESGNDCFWVQMISPDVQGGGKYECSHYKLISNFTIDETINSNPIIWSQNMCTTYQHVIYSNTKFVLNVSRNQLFVPYKSAYSVWFIAPINSNDALYTARQTFADHSSVLQMGSRPPRTIEPSTFTFTLSRCRTQSNCSEVINCSPNGRCLLKANTCFNISTGKPILYDFAEITSSNCPAHSEGLTVTVCDSQDLQGVSCVNVKGSHIAELNGRYNCIDNGFSGFCEKYSNTYFTIGLRYEGFQQTWTGTVSSCLGCLYFFFGGGGRKEVVTRNI